MARACLVALCFASAAVVAKGDCTPTPSSCCLACGTSVPLNWTGMNEGRQKHHRCSCTDQDGVGNLDLVCDLSMVLSMDECPPPKSGCELTCGQTVADGWSGTDDGSNACNTCTCKDGNMGCTKQLCPAAKCPGQCSLRCGTAVPDKWSGADEGANACNTCSCNSGSMVCTMKMCPPKNCTPA